MKRLNLLLLSPKVNPGRAALIVRLTNQTLFYPLVPREKKWINIKQQRQNLVLQAPITFNVCIRPSKRPLI